MIESTFEEFIDKIYSNSEDNEDFSLCIGESNLYITYDSADKELEFRIAFTEDEEKELIFEDEKLVKILDDIAKTSKLHIEHNFNDPMGCPFVEEVFSINITKNNKFSIINFIDNLSEEFNLMNLGYTAAHRNIKFRPKARLLSILGEQLISNEIVAIKELVLNAFDADATEVNIDFNVDMVGNYNTITITDDGKGMDDNVIINGWFTPATSIKTKAKKTFKTEKYNRPILGEKGVGRFACRRLGQVLDVSTRTKNFDKELYFNIEWAQYDIEDDDVFLDEIENNIFYRRIVNSDSNKLKSILENYDSGTCLTIKKLRDNWNENKIDELKTELMRLVPPFENVKEFKILINGVEIKNDIFLEKALYYLEAIIDKEGYAYYIMGDFPRKHIIKPGQFVELINFNRNIEEQLIELAINYEKIDLKESKPWKTYIKNSYRDNSIERTDMPLCGNFTFCAFAWDLDSIHTKFVGINDKRSKQLLKSLSGISIYRDGFRVWPYGTDGNDWLTLDKRTQGGGKPFHIANHQVIGYVGISQENNSYFKDKSNREGFIEDGYVFEDFKLLILSIFSKLENYRYLKSRKERSQKDAEYWQEDKVITQIEKLQDEIEKVNPQFKESVGLLKKSYIERKQYSETKISNLLEVSSSGIVFESVTHELISFLNKIDDQSTNIKNFLSMNKPIIEDAINSNILLHEALKIVLYEVKELQPFFKAARYQQKELDLKTVAEKSMKYFKYKFIKYNIKYKVEEISPMKRRAVEGFLLQIFTNLIDNAVYWLDFINIEKEILITIDGNESSVYFSDNGIGIDKNDEPFIFEPFFTQKEVGKGRGLGLYIVQELLSNYRGNITISEKYKPNSCSTQNKGACFKIYIP